MLGDPTLKQLSGTVGVVLRKMPHEEHVTFTEIVGMHPKMCRDELRRVCSVLVGFQIFIREGRGEDAGFALTDHGKVIQAGLKDGTIHRPKKNPPGRQPQYKR